MSQLDGGERTMLMDCIGHQGQRGYIRIGPQPALVIGLAISCRMNLHFFGGHHSPAAFGLDAPQGRERARLSPTHAVAMRHLVEAVACYDWPDPNRLEQHIV